MMEIIFLGTTAAVPTVNRGHSSIALKYMDEVVLWDCGEGAQRQLITSKTSYMRIDKIFITHFHGDHFLGLPGLVQTLSFSNREKPLHVFGPKGIKEVLSYILELGEYDLGFEVIPYDISDGFEVREDNYKIKCIKVNHSIPTYGLVFEEIKGREFLIEKAKKLGLKPGPAYSRLQRGESVRLGGKEITPEQVLGDVKKGIKVVYSSDTLPCASVKENCSEAVLIHDSTFDDAIKDKAVLARHSTSVDAATVAKEGGAERLFLTHISPRYKDPGILNEQARKIFKNSEVARDLMRVTI